MVPLNELSCRSLYSVKSKSEFKQVHKFVRVLDVQMIQAREVVDEGRECSRELVLMQSSM